MDLYPSGRNCHRTPVKGFGIADATGPLSNNAEIVQCVRQIRMERTQFGFLNARGTPQQFVGRHEVASGGSPFCLIQKITCVRQFRHRLPGAALQLH